MLYDSVEAGFRTFTVPIALVYPCYHDLIQSSKLVANIFVDFIFPIAAGVLNSKLPARASEDSCVT